MQIKDYETTQRRPTIGTFSLVLDSGLIIKNLRHMAGGYGEWIAYPSQKVEKDGETEYYHIVYFEDKDKKDLFQKQILDLIYKY